MPKDEAGAARQRLDPARRERIAEAIRGMLASKKRGKNEAGPVVAELEKWAVALARRPGEEPYIGPLALFSGVRRTAQELREALAKLIQQRAVEQAQWDYSGFLRRPGSLGVAGAKIAVEANRLHGELSLGQALYYGKERVPGALQVSVEAMQGFLATLVLLADAPPRAGSPETSKRRSTRGRREDQERAFLQDLVLLTLKRAGLPHRASEPAAEILAEIRAHAFGDPPGEGERRGPSASTTKPLSRLRYAAAGKARKGRKASDIERTIAQFSLAERARARLEPTQGTPTDTSDSEGERGLPPVKK